MKATIAGVFALALFAASSSVQAASENMYFVTVDTVGNCSVTQGKPSAGQTALGETGGYKDMADAEAKLNKIRDDDSTCKGVVE